jgi:KDO2-lipid IV(A) lauroyltransferase
MDYKNTGKLIRRYSGRAAFKAFSLIIKVLPESWLCNFFDFISVVGYYIAGRHRRIALDSLDIAFGKEKTRDQIKRIAKDSFRYMARGAIEVLYVIERPYLAKQKVRIEGRAHLDKALSGGRGAILVSAHFGNFPLMLLHLAQEGYKTNAIIRRMRDQKMDEHLLKKRDTFGIITIYSTPRKACVDRSLKALRNNELLFIQLDQNFGTGGIFVDFFGMKAATATGPAVFALRTGAPILPAFIIRGKDNKFKIVIEPAMHIKREHSDTVIKDTVQKLTNIIETYIRKYPAEWGWIHRRWKSRPNK